MSLFSGRFPGSLRRRKYSVGITPVFGGLVLICLAYIGYQVESPSETWPSAQGTVSVSEKIRTSNGKNMRFEYRYSVNGSSYRSSRVNYSQDLQVSFAFDPWAAVNRYPTGSTVAVYYDPRNPRDALLEPGVAPAIKWALAAGVVAVIFGIVLCLRMAELYQEDWDA